ncbi:MAG: HlyC/CorC family transporter [Ruminococcaceae bacterium]|nr:HlyC/CorC family transporter [Oscillospiraceae bacterium]
MDGDSSILSIIILIILIIFSAFFSATETAFLSFNKVKMKTAAQDGNKKAQKILDLFEKYDKLISTVLIGNNIVNIAASSIATVLFVQTLEIKNGATWATVVMTVVVLICGEITPKRIAKEIPDKITMLTYPFIKFLTVVFTPLSFLLNLWQKLVTKLFKFKEESGMTEDELITIVDEAQQEGGIDEDEGELIRSAIEFNDVEVRDIITPRVDVSAVPADATIDEVATVFYETGYSRLPVYNSTIDDIIGILHEKDFYYIRHKGIKDFHSAIGKAVYVSEHVQISDLLKKFQLEKAHMAIVLDDFGGTLGICTLEDILEELVGDIWDEHDEIVEQFKKCEDGSVTVDASTRALDMFEYFDIKPLDENDLPQTVNGWVLKEFGHLPEPGESFDYKNMHVEVLKSDEKIVEEVRITVENEDDDSDDNKKSADEKSSD